MQTSDTVDTTAGAREKASPLQYGPSSVAGRRRPVREVALLVSYHLRLLGRWPFVVMLLAYVGCGLIAWAETQTGDDQSLRNAADLSRFVMEPGAALFAGVLMSSLIVTASDPMLEVTMATPVGLRQVVMWRLILSFSILLVSSAAYLIWSLGIGISYARQQNWLYLLLMWLAPALAIGMLGLFGALLTRNAALGAAIAAIPLAVSLFLYDALARTAAAHPLLVTYTYSGGQDAPDWWANRLALLAIALALAVVNVWLLSREERLLGSFA